MDHLAVRHFRRSLHNRLRRHSGTPWRDDWRTRLHNRALQLHRGRWRRNLYSGSFPNEFRRIRTDLGARRPVHQAVLQHLRPREPSDGLRTVPSTSAIIRTTPHVSLLIISSFSVDFLFFRAMNSLRIVLIVCTYSLLIPSEGVDPKDNSRLLLLERYMKDLDLKKIHFEDPSGVRGKRDSRDNDLFRSSSHASSSIDLISCSQRRFWSC